MPYGIYIRTEEHNKKNGESHKKEKLSVKTLLKMRLAKLGKKQSFETIEKRRLKLLGQKRTEETKRKISESNKGKNTGRNHTIETKRKISQAGKIRKERYGYYFSEETKRKISESHKGIVPSEETRKKMSEVKKGNRTHLWKGGITSQNMKIRKSLEYRLWREKILKRDNYTCNFCGIQSKKGKFIYLQADHIKPFSLFPALRFELNNGRTLCVPCHKNTDTYASKIFNYKLNM